MEVCLNYQEKESMRTQLEEITLIPEDYLHTHFLVEKRPTKESARATEVIEVKYSEADA